MTDLHQERLHRLLSRYLRRGASAWNPHFRRRAIDELALMVCFSPASIVARDQAYFAATR